MVIKSYKFQFIVYFFSIYFVFSALLKVRLPKITTNFLGSYRIKFILY